MLDYPGYSSIVPKVKAELGLKFKLTNDLTLQHGCSVVTMWARLCFGSASIIMRIRILDGFRSVSEGVPKKTEIKLKKQYKSLFKTIFFFFTV